MFGDMNQFYSNLESALKILEEADRGDNDLTQLEQRQEKHDAILKMVTECIHKSSEMNNTVECLREENVRLTNRSNYEKAKSRTLQQKLKKILKNQELFMKMKEEYQAMSKAIKDQKLISEKHSSTVITVANNSDKYVQVDYESADKSHIFDNATQTDDSPSWQSREGEPGYIPRIDVDRLDEDINTLKELLNERELIWGKLATRERVQRLHLNRLTIELEELRQVDNRQKTELELKDKVLQELTKDLEGERSQVRKLRKYVTKLERATIEGNDQTPKATWQTENSPSPTTLKNKIDL